MAALPQFRKFDIHDEPTSLGTRWKTWISEFQNLILALGVRDKKRQRALLLYYAGSDVHNIYKTLITETQQDEDFEAAKAKLDLYFEPKVNITYEVYHFRRMKQGESETAVVSAEENIDSFVTRLQEKAVRCGFSDKEKEIKYQIIFGCRSSKLRREGLKKDETTLQEIIELGRTYDRVKMQAKDMEKDKVPAKVHSVGPGRYSRKANLRKEAKKGEHSGTKKKDEQSASECFHCGGVFPHPGGREKCPAWGKKCRRCGNPNHLEKKCMTQKINCLDSSRIESEESSSNDEYVYSGSDSDESVNVIEKKKKQKEKSPKTRVSLQIEQVPVTLSIDTGASVNLLNKSTYDNLKKVTLKKTSMRVYPYNSRIPLKLLGKFDATVESKWKVDVIPFYVVDGENDPGNILGLKASENLGLIKFINELKEEIDLKAVIEEYSNKGVFDGVGRMKGVQVEYDIDPNVTPKAQRHRVIPFHLRSAVDTELNKLHEADSIEVVTKPTGWVSPVVLENKEDGSIRLCVDMREANKALRRVHHVILSTDDIKDRVRGSKFFSKIDLKKGFNQVELSEESRNITTFSTHRGLARFKVLNFGAKPNPEIFHEEIRKRIDLIEGALNKHDDILIFGPTKEKHHKAVRDVLEMMSEGGLTANREKCEFFKTSVKFFGLIVNADGKLNVKLCLFHLVV